MKILAVNSGSTSTKLAVYDNEMLTWRESIYHSREELSAFREINDQYEYRLKSVLSCLEKAGVSISFDAVVARGGLLHPMPGGVYLIDEHVLHDLWNAERHHASNLAAPVAAYIASKSGCPAYFADSVVTDEFRDEARISGLPEIPRASIFHALNSRAVSRQYASSIGRRYEDLCIIVARLGGGITVSAHERGRVVDCNNAIDGDGAFTPERTGSLPAIPLVDLCFSGRYTREQLHKKLIGHGGLMAHLGTTDVATIVRWANAGNAKHRLVLDAMLYDVSKQIGSMHAALRCRTDAVIVTGGIAYSDYCVGKIREWAGGIAPIVVIPGEDEMRALAMNALGVLRGKLELKRYS